MTTIKFFNQFRFTILFLILIAGCSSLNNKTKGQKNETILKYTLTIANPSNHYYHIDLDCNGWVNDTIIFKMPKWMPGYYQIMDYYKNVENIVAKNKNGNSLQVVKQNENTWQLVVAKNTPFNLSYDVKSDKEFVASNYLDSTHGYIVPPATFLYIKDHINTPVSIKVVSNNQWKNIATGLDSVPGKQNEFSASDFDLLYDCPILIGNLKELPPFEVKGIKHRFIGYNVGEFNKTVFTNNLKKVVQASVDIFGDIPYNQYTFIGIGPGYGGIEHLNNTTISFNGNKLDDERTMKGVMKYIAHEYFHNYNVKRIRPYELGPFDYDKENRTNLLWVSEGLTVYYEYIVAVRAGVINEQDFILSLERNINTTENNPGHNFQSLTQASYNTWSDGPFGQQGKSISYYEKGPIIGLILDLAIRNATDNNKSLDDVMRQLYWHYYKELGRGFTDAEFQQTCESIAGVSLSSEFEYVNTTKDIDYNKYLSYAGLKIEKKTNPKAGYKRLIISKVDNANLKQKGILLALVGDNIFSNQLSY